MGRRIIIGTAIAILVLLAVGALWAKTALTGDAVRAALASQVSKAIGQPVSIGRVEAGILPRLTVTLGDVTIGQPVRATVRQLHIGTDFRALLSRRIEHASLKLDGARIELPLPPLSVTSATPSPAGSVSVVEIVSVDEVLLNGVEVVSGGRTLKGNIDVVPQGQGLAVRRIALEAEGTSVVATGRLTDLTGPVGTLDVQAGELDLDRLMVFANQFAAGSTAASSSASRSSSPSSAGTAAPAASRANVTLALAAHKATIGTLTLQNLSGKALIAGEGLTLEPVAFGILGGRYEGSLALALDRETIRFKGVSKLTNIDVAAAMTFIGSPNTISGRLTGRSEFSGAGVDAASVTRTVRGQARVDIVDGTIRNLGLLNSVVVATSMRAGSLERAVANGQTQSPDEPFSTLGATFLLSDGAVTTGDLRLESKDLLLSAGGTVRLAASTVDMKGRVQLSDALSAQAGRDLVRYTQDQGRVTLPVTITGTLAAPSARIDTFDLAKRALLNAAEAQKGKATEQINSELKKRLGGLFGR